MYKVFYQPENTWMGDIMPYGKEGKFFLYHQRDPRDPGPLTLSVPFGWSLSTTEDFLNYKDFGDVIPNGGDNDIDQFIYAGNVFEAKGKVHAFYTGFNREWEKEGKVSQVLLHGESEDFIHWKKNVGELKLPPQAGYDFGDWRDPKVIWNQEKKEYLLILGARLEGPKTKMSGRLVSFTSKNLENWEFNGDFYTPNIYTMIEMPDLFKMGDWWYLVYTEYSDESKTRYRMSKNIDGPWIKPKDDAFDGRAYYAARTAFDGKRRVLFGWVPTKEKNDDMNNFEWGGTFVPEEIVQRRDGTLGVKLPETLINAFEEKKTIGDEVIHNEEGLSEKILFKNVGNHFLFNTKVLFEEVSGFSIRLFKNQETDESYEFLISVDNQHVVFDKSPNFPWYQVMNKGLQRPVKLECGKEHDIKVVCDDDILVILVDDVCLTARVYNKFGNDLAVTATNGSAIFKDINLRK
ncbi:hypothetical protein ABEV36_06605 [Heyndrickxia faecalis]|uniref:hypothetical protein n=1 Tax=Heyndrickxia faecalis TaxID=2824910 RepID=UPI003D1D5C95